MLLLTSPALAQNGNHTGAYSGVGQCPAGNGVTGLNANAPPTCKSTMIGTGLYNGTINVKDAAYGAKGDNTTDDTAAIQSAINASCAAVGNVVYNQTPPVYIPPGVYLISSPLIVSCAYPQHIFGAGRTVSVLHAATYFPIIYVEPHNAVSAFGTRSAASLATGAGNSLSWDLTHPYYYNLVDSTTGNNTGAWKNAQPLNGLAAFSAEMFINFAATGTNGNAYFIASSQGEDNAAITQNFAFNMNVVQGAGTSTLQGCLYVSTTHEVCASGSITNATTYEVELSYDGSNLRLFAGIPGSTTSLLGTTAATGTIVQIPSQSFELGDTVSGHAGFALQGDANMHWLGQLDSIRFSNTARHTSTYTAPTTKFTSDNNTLLLINGTSFPDSFLFFDYNAGGSNGYLPAYWMGTIQTGTQRHQIDNLSLFNGTYGIFVAGAIQGTIDKIATQSTTVAGIKLWNDSYGWSVRDIQAQMQTYAQAGVETLYLSGLQHLENIITGGGFYGILLGSGGSLNTATYFASSVAVAGLWATTDLTFQSTTITEFVTDVENGGTMVPLKYIGTGTLQVIGGNLQMNTLDCSDPAMIADATSTMAGVTLDGTVASTCSTAPELINIIAGSSLRTPVTWIRGTANGNALSALNPASLPISNDMTHTMIIADVPPTSTVANLASCNSNNINLLAGVTDCDSCTFGHTCVHSGSPTFPVCQEICTGAAWVVQ